MSGHRLYPTLTALAIALAPAGARADDPRRVGIVVTTAVNITDSEIEPLTEELGAALAKALPVDVIAGRETRRRLSGEGVPDDCVADAECRQDLGRRLDAAELLMLVVVRIGDRIQIDTTWANVASGRVISRPAIELAPGDDRAAVLEKAAPTLLPHIRREETQVTVVIPPGGGDGGRHMTTGSWIATAVSGAALVGGTIFALSARSKYQSLDGDDCRVMPCPQDRVDALSRHALAADVLYGVALASGVTAIVLYVRSDDGREPKPASAVSIGVGPGDVGLAVGGVF